MPETARRSKPPAARAFGLLKSAVFFGAAIVVVVLALWFTRRDALKYFDWSPETYRRFWPHRELLALHVLGAGVALLVGPLQFVKAVRGRWPGLHRLMGWTYVVAVMLTMPVAIRLALYTSCALCVSPFVTWGIVTMVVTLAAVVTAVMGSWKTHRDFMIRSYALMYGFVLVRLDAHLLGTPLEIPLDSGTARNSMVLWLAWVLPLLAVEFFISWLPAVRRSWRPKRRFEGRRASAEGPFAGSGPTGG